MLNIRFDDSSLNIKYQKKNRDSPMSQISYAYPPFIKKEDSFSIKAPTNMTMRSNKTSLYEKSPIIAGRNF